MRLDRTGRFPHTVYPLVKPTVGTLGAPITFRILPDLRRLIRFY